MHLTHRTSRRRGMSLVTRSAAITAGLVGSALGTTFAADDKTEPGGLIKPAKLTFNEHVLPILREHCLSCHHAGDKKGGLAMDTYTALIEGGGSGEIVYDDGDADASRLWQLVNHDDTPVMPPSKQKLPDAQLKILRAWIEGGILENDGSVAKPKKKNVLASVSVSTGRPEGGGAMPTPDVPVDPPVVTPRPAAATAIAAAPWAPLVAIGGQKQIVLYNSDTHRYEGVLAFPEGIAQSLRFNADGSFLIAGGGKHSVRGLAAIYDVKTGNRVATVGDDLDTVFDADVDASMGRVAMGGPQKMLRIYDATDGTKLFDIKKHTDWIYSVAYSPDGVLLASADRSGGVTIWEAETGQEYLSLAGHKGAVRDIAWRDDSNVLATAGEDKAVKLWNVADGKQIKSVGLPGPATAIDFDHQSRFVVSTANHKTVVFDAGGNAVKTLPDMSDSVLEAVITHDGKRVVRGDWTGEVQSIAIDDFKSSVSLASNPPSLKTRIASADGVIASIQQQLAPIEAAIAAERTKRKKVDDQVGQIKTQLAELRKTLEQKSSEQSKADASLKAAMQTRSKLAAETIAIEKQVAAARSKPDDNTAALIAAEKSQLTKLGRLVAARESVMRSRQTLDGAKKLVAQTGQKIAAAEKQSADLAKQIVAIDQQIAKHEQSRKAKLAELESQQAERSRWASLATK